MLRLSELSSAEHHLRATIWRERIKGVVVTTSSLVVAMMIMAFATRNEYWGAWSAITFWIGVLIIILMFIPLVRHNRKDDQFT